MSYFFLFRGAKRGLKVCVCVSFLILVFSVQAQDIAPTEDPQETPLATEITPIPTQEISPAPTEDLLLPTQEITPVATQDVLPTEEITPVETPTPIAEDSLPLAFSTNFDAVYPTDLSAKTGWIDVTVANGTALQANGEAVAVNYTAATFADAAVEANFLLNTGDGQIMLRDYVAGLSATGTVTLYRQQAIVSSNIVTLTDGQWSHLRLQVVGTQIQVSVDNTVIIDYTDSNVVSAGTAGFSASAGGILRLDDFAIYGIAIPVILTPTGIPTEEITPVETPTPIAEDSLPLAFNTNFDAVYPTELSAKTGWIDVTVANGTALQANGEAVAVNYTAATFADAAVEASFLLNTGEGQILLRDYVAGLSATGTVTLYRQQAVVSSSVVTLTDGQWVHLRLQVVGTQIQVSVDNIIIIDYADSDVVPAGTAGFSASAEAVLRVDDFAIYGIATPVISTPTEVPNEAALSIAALGEPLNVPTNVVLTGNGASVDVSWDDTNLSETGYEIQRYVSDSYLATSIIGATGVDAGTFTEVNVGCGLTLWYRVRAVRSSDSAASDWSDWVSVTTTPCTAACNPSNAVQRVSVGSNETYQTTGMLVPSGRSFTLASGFTLFGSINPLQNPTSELSGENNVPGVPDVYLYSLDNCTTYNVSMTEGGAESAQAAYPGAIDLASDPLVIFDSTDPNLTSNDGSSLSSVFMVSGGNLIHISGQLVGNSKAIDVDFPYILMSTDGSLTGVVGSVTDSNNVTDLVLYKFITSSTNTLDLVSAGTDGNTANAASLGGRVFVADDGTPYVLFNSAASNLVSGDTNGISDVFLRNMTTGVTTRISLSDAEGQLASASSLGGFSVVGNTLKVAFETASRETGIAGGPTRILVRTVSLLTPASGTTILASRATGAAGTIAATSSSGGKLSGDGRWVVFSSADSKLAAGDTNGVSDVFVRDLTSNVTQRISFSNSGAQLTKASTVVDVSEDGKKIFFSSADGAVVANDAANVCETDMVDSNPSLPGIQYDYNDNCTDIFATSNPLSYSATPTNMTATTNFSDKVRLTWSPVSAVQGFIIEASTDGITWNQTATISDGGATFYDYSLVCGASVKLRIKSTVTTPYPLVSSVSSVVTGKTTTCLAPVLSSPTDKAPLNTATVTLMWSKPHPDIYRYEIDLAKTATFTAATRVAGYPQTVDAETFNSAALADGTYYWRVRALLPGVGSYSVTRSFIVDTLAPVSPLITAPENASTVRSMTIKFTWTAAPTANRYSLVVTDGTNVMVNQSSLTQLTYTFTGTPIQSIYTATVIAYDAAGNASIPSQITFTLNPALTPANNEAVITSDGWNPTDVTFTWAGPGTASYAVQVFYEDNLATQVNGCFAVGVLTCTIPNMGPQTYYWRVLREDEDTNIVSPVSNKFYLRPELPSIGLETPANNTYLIPAQRPSGEVTLTWDKGFTATPAQLPLSYDVEVNTSSTFAVEPAFTATNLSAQTVTTSSLADGTYYWRVKAKNALGAPGAWSVTFKFMIDSVAPAIPAIVTPANLALIQTPRPTITWTGPTDAYRYEVEINETCGDGSPVYSSGATITAKTFTPLTPVRQGLLQVCVRAYDVSMNPSGFSPARTIKVFLGTAPADYGFVPSTTKPTFTWSAAAGTGLTLEYSINELFPTISTTQIAVTGTSKTLDAPLAPGVYYWRVKRAGEVLPLAFTDPYVYRTFYVGSILPAPTPTTPANGTSLSASTTTLDLNWQDVDPAPIPNLDITDYQIVISKSSTFVPALTTTTTVSEGTQTYQWLLPTLQNRVTHYWRVRAMSGSMPVSNWSTTRSVIIDNVIPAVPTITTPISNALLNTVRPTFTWGAVAGATSYSVSITDMTTSTDLVSDVIVTTPSFTPPVNLTQNSLMFTVLSSDGLNQSASAVVMFNVRLGTAPAQNAAVTTSRPSFTWAAVPGTSVRYTLEVSRDAAFIDSVFTQSNIATTSYTPTTIQALTSGGVYYWRVDHTGANNGFPANDGARSFTYNIAAKPINLAAHINGTSGAVETLFSADEDSPIGLTWDAPTSSVTAIGYQVELATNATFTTGLVVINAGTSTSTTITEGMFTDGLKYWRVKALYSVDGTSAATSDTKSFTLDTVAPATPLDRSPSGILTVSRPTFKWASAATAVRYHLTLYRDNTQTATSTMLSGYEDVLLTKTSYTIPPSAAPLPQLRKPYESYRWIVRAEDAAGNLSAPISNYFSVQLGSVTNTKGFVVDSTPTFTWEGNAGVGSSTVTLQIATDSDMTNVIRTSGDLPASSTSYTVPNAEALPEGRFYWRVLRNIDNSQDVLSWSFIRVSSLASITPTLTGASTLTLGDSQIQANPLTWNAITPPGGSSSCCYNIRLYTSPPTSDTASSYLNFGISQTSAGSVFVGIPSGTYYWRVQARIGYGADSYEGPWSAYRRFVYDNTPPSIPVLTLPVSQAVIATTRRPTFTWGASTGGAAQYVFEIGTDSSFNSNVLYTVTLTSPLSVTLPASEALPNGIYYWRVRSRDTLGNTSADNVRQFRIAVP